MDRSNCDVIIIGMGVGAAAIAHQLLTVNASVIMLPGAGRPRFSHLDGGVINPEILAGAFGDTFGAPVQLVGDQHVFRRDDLEAWAMARVADRVQVIHDFEEARAIPHDTGKLTLVDATGEQTLTANCIVLTEGANPKIGIAARLREDFRPEDMIHFGRAFVPGVSLAQAVTGEWRTSWNMPAWYSAVPVSGGVLVSASARIENIMRAGHDGRDTLRDWLSGPQAKRIGIAGIPDQIGMELVPLRSTSRPTRIGAHNLMIALDANGTIDARSLQRFNATVSGGQEMGAMMAREWPTMVEWDDVGMSMWDVFSTTRTPYHDDHDTGFIEDGPAPQRSLLNRLLNRR